jgi:tRNA C32,U32 (ribose-2'-O)-methylase TrmJ
VLLDALRDSGYLGPNSTASGEAKIRRLVRRLNLPAEDAELWLGMFRQIAWKTRSEAGPPD